MPYLPFRSLYRNLAFHRSLSALGQSPDYKARMKEWYPRQLRWCLISTFAIQVQWRVEIEVTNQSERLTVAFV